MELMLRGLVGTEETKRGRGCALFPYLVLAAPASGAAGTIRQVTRVMLVGGGAGALHEPTLVSVSHCCLNSSLRETQVSKPYNISR